MNDPEAEVLTPERIAETIELAMARGLWVGAYHPVTPRQRALVVVRQHAAAICDGLEDVFSGRILWVRIEQPFYVYALLTPPTAGELRIAGRKIVSASRDLPGVVDVVEPPPGGRSWQRKGTLFVHVPQTFWRDNYAHIPVSQATFFCRWATWATAVA